ncbi:MAG: hypothetical protein O3B25_09790 [Verrucomicrobia bacterium]|nr:hypothetical protein [Verrucomicrobiota bacterium]
MRSIGFRLVDFMARGNRRENIVLGDDDRWMFLHTLGEMAGRASQSIPAKSSGRAKVCNPP